MMAVQHGDHFGVKCLTIVFTISHRNLPEQMFTMVIGCPPKLTCVFGLGWRGVRASRWEVDPISKVKAKFMLILQKDVANCNFDRQLVNQSDTVTAEGNKLCLFYRI